MKPQLPPRRFARSAKRILWLSKRIFAEWKDIEKSFAQVQKLGGLHVLINAAGITGKTNILTQEVPIADWDDVFAINSRGIFLSCLTALPIMEKQKYSRIVNIASVAGKEGNASMAA
eukprot:EC714489.1.p3 GENE.EC714489.1~~EC714489.1.p3  ORF type:complete len:117 (+),score=12.30 EC714489.1:165-515(+)